MKETLFHRSQDQESHIAALRALLAEIDVPYGRGDRVAVKLHWGERGNESFLPPRYAREIVRWLTDQGTRPLICDTSALYSGGRRTGSDSLVTAGQHGYTETYLGCPVVMADGADSRDVISLSAQYRHFDEVAVAALIEAVDGFFIFSHFKGHLESGFGGAIKNISMGFASRPQKQRIHADAHPVLDRDRCTGCGTCAAVCPVGAATMAADGFPRYDLDTCIGCSQCIALCPEIALKIFWAISPNVFQERLVEVAAALWHRMADRSIVVNALVGITKECDCMTGHNPAIAPDIGMIGGHHPVTVDLASIDLVGEDIVTGAHPSVPWQRQFEYAREIGFVEDPAGITP